MDDYTDHDGVFIVSVTLLKTGEYTLSVELNGFPLTLNYDTGDEHPKPLQDKIVVVPAD